MVIQCRPHCSATYAVEAVTARRIEDKVVGIGGHEETALDNLGVGLYDDRFIHEV
jgi:hypothetical protein